MVIKKAAAASMATRHTIYVLAASETATAVAIGAALQIAAAQDAELVVLVPHVVPYGTDLASCGHDLAKLGEPCRALIGSSRLSATIRVCACREAKHIFSLMLIERAYVVVAGRRGRWWRSRDERLARDLECEGHDVVFIDLGAHRSATDVAGRGRPSLRLVKPSIGPHPATDRQNHWQSVDAAARRQIFSASRNAVDSARSNNASRDAPPGRRYSFSGYRPL